jgi:hypothetical protein
MSVTVTDDETAYLVGWKRIAAYLDLGVRTAQRREADAGLPVKRFPGPDKTPQVYVVKKEVDKWLLTRSR